MENEESQKLRRDLAETLKKERENIEVLEHAIFAYLMYGSMTNPTYDELPEDQARKLPDLTEKVRKYMTGIAEANIKGEIPEDFDLFLISFKIVSEVVERKKIEGDTGILEDMLLTSAAATFRMWFDRVNAEDIIAFLEDREHGELPDMADSSLTFEWAVEKGIPCSDMRSLFEIIGDTENPGDQHVEHEAIGAMRDMFDDLVPVFVSLGIPRQFIDENLEACKNMFMMSQVFYQIIPSTVDFKKKIEEEGAMDRLYECLIGLGGPALLEPMNGDEHNPYYRQIFTAGMTTRYVMNLYNPEDHQDIYESAVKRMAEKYKK